MKAVSRSVGVAFNGIESYLSYIRADITTEETFLCYWKIVIARFLFSTPIWHHPKCGQMGGLFNLPTRFFGLTYSNRTTMMKRLFKMHCITMVSTLMFEGFVSCIHFYILAGSTFVKIKWAGMILPGRINLRCRSSLVRLRRVEKHPHQEGFKELY